MLITVSVLGYESSVAAQKHSGDLIYIPFKFLQLTGSINYQVKSGG